MSGSILPVAQRPRRRVARGWLTLALMALAGTTGAADAAPRKAAGQAAPVSIDSFDQEHTSFGFEMRTRWGQRIRGTFPEFEGELVELADGRQQVRIRLDTAAVEVAGSRRYTAMARGPRFFDAERHPVVEFVSDPYPASLVQTGGALRGRLSMCGVSRVETFELAPPQCPRPGRDCNAKARGSVDRGDYALTDWRLVLDDTVRFELQLRLQEPAQAAAR
ncbi:MAG: YceI family protein [Pseudomonadota bacterium]|nr:YceI family protein [Pseudomonadota bacterium]